MFGAEKAKARSVPKVLLFILQNASRGLNAETNERNDLISLLNLLLITFATPAYILINTNDHYQLLIN